MPGDAFINRFKIAVADTEKQLKQIENMVFHMTSDLTVDVDQLKSKVLGAMYQIEEATFESQNQSDDIASNLDAIEMTVSQVDRQVATLPSVAATSAIIRSAVEAMLHQMGIEDPDKKRKLAYLLNYGFTRALAGDDREALWKASKDMYPFLPDSDIEAAIRGGYDKAVEFLAEEKEAVSKKQKD